MMRNKINSIPIYVWVIIIVSYIIPIALDDAEGTYEMFWFMFLTPSFFLSYFFGLNGGITTAIISTLLHVAKELYDYVMDQSYNMHNFGYLLSIMTINIAIAISCGILSDKFKKQQEQLENANKQLHFLNEELKRLSLIDELTSLWNRRGFLNLVQNRMGKESVQQMSILFIDLDGFKAVNDRFGHGMGDVLLQIVGERLKDCIREDDVVSRLGGDEFVLMLSKAEKSSAEKVAQRIMKALEQPFIFDGQEVYITPSIGISLYPSHGNSVDTLIKNADIAMYHAKQQGKNNYQFYQSA